MDTQSIKEENAALGRILTGDFYRIVWNITTPSYFSRKEANYSVHFSVIWKFFLVVSSRISTLYHVYQRLPLIVEEFDFKFLIEIILTLSFFSLTTLYRMARNSNLANFGTINLHHFRRCFFSKRSSLEHPFEPLRKHDARYDVYAAMQWSHLRGTFARSNIQVRSQELVGDVPPSIVPDYSRRIISRGIGNKKFARKRRIYYY